MSGGIEDEKHLGRIERKFAGKSTRYTDGVENAKSTVPSSNIKGVWTLNKGEFERVYPLHIRREKGEAVSEEAKKAIANQVYWYGILTDCLK